MKSELMNLVLKVQSFNDVDSYEKIRLRFENLIHKTAIITMNKFQSIPIDKEDLVNILTFQLYKTIMDYNPESRMMFPTYVKEQLRYKAMNYVRGLISKNHEVMNYSVEFTDESHEHKEEKDSKETLEMIMNDYKEYEFLTEREKIILGAMLEELDIKVIAERLNLTESSIYKIKKTISKKLKEHLEL